MSKSKTLVLPPALGSYVNIFKPRPPPRTKAPGAEKLYSIVLLWPKAQAAGTGPDSLAEFRKAALEVAEEAWPGEGERVLARMKYPVLDDGDERYPENPAFKGQVFVHAKRKESFGPPGVVDASVQPVFDQERAYSGCTFRAQVTLFPYDNEGGRGVGVGLSNLQVVREGKRLDGRQAPEEAFAGYADEKAPEKGEKGRPEKSPAKKRNPWD